MIFAPRLGLSPAVREVFNYGTLGLLCLTFSTIAVFCLRYLLVYALLRMRVWPAIRVLVKNEVFALGIVMTALFFLVFGTMHFRECRVSAYDVNLTDGTPEQVSQCRIGLVSDLHLGGGGSAQLVERTCRRLEEQQPDMICIVGDLVDMTSYASDLEAFAERITRLRPRYGIYYVEGNHERDSALDCPAVLTAHGVVCLKDEAVALENGLVLVGRSNDHLVPVPEILERAALPEDAVVVLSHIPVGLIEMQAHPYLVLCGHTHGYQVPLYGPFHPFANELIEGYHEFGRLKAVTSTGAAAWGYRIKWPSFNEICVIRLVYASEVQP